MTVANRRDRTRWWLSGIMVCGVAAAGVRLDTVSRRPTGIAAFHHQTDLATTPNAAGSQPTQRDGAGSAVTLVVDGPLGAPSQYGLARFEQALRSKGVTLRASRSLVRAGETNVLVVGTEARSALVRELKAEMALPDAREALAVKRVRRGQRTLLVVAGRDERGLMYALLELAQQLTLIDRGQDWWTSLRETVERPAVPVRGMVVLLHNQDDERDWYYSKEYWDEYLGMLAADRWNSFNLVFSHQTPYLAPMYPFHVKVEKYPEVRAKGLTDAQREKNLEMLRFISSMARDRGLDFTLSIWQQIAWDSGPVTRAQESMVTGYNRQNMTDYTYLALSKLLRECPGITGIQLRLNYESGINYDEQTAFFRDAVFRAAREAGRPILVEMRDIGLLSETTDAALQFGLPVRVSHKYWGEHMVFPYHPARFIWSYSYGDWLRYPRKAEQIYQVWSLGSHRLLSWGDPEFVRRFAPTTIFEDGAGFEICAPLSQKGYLNAPGAWPIFRDKAREYYRWEYQRYWSFYRLFGRLTYNPGGGDEVWTRELGRRFGTEAAPEIGKAYRWASQVISLIAGSAISNYNMGTWPEKDMGGLINYYVHLLPYDRARIRGFLEYADDVLAGRSSGRLGPEDVAARLEAIASATDQAFDTARPMVRSGEQEFWATDMDFRILSGMARYHAQKMRAATRLALYYRTGDLAQLRQAIGHAETALATWKELSARADEIYSSNLVFGPGSVGHWKDNLQFVEEDLKELRDQEDLFRTTQNADYAFDFGPAPLSAVTEAWSAIYTNAYTVAPRFRGVFPDSRYDPAVGFGWIEARDLKAEQPTPVPGNVWRGASKNDRAFPPEALLGDFIRGTQPAVFRIDLPEGHYQGTVMVTDRSTKPADHGPMTVSVVERFGERPVIDGIVVRAGQTVIKRFNFNMIGERFSTFRLKFTADPGADYVVNALTIARVEPHIAHVALSTARPGHDLRVTATVTVPPPPNDERPPSSLGIITSNASTLDVPDRVVRVTLRYATGPDDAYRSVEMQASDPASYSVTLPAADLNARDIRYYLEAEDSTGRVVRFPKESAERPYFRTDLTDDRTAPVVVHTAVTDHAPGQSLEIRAKVTDDSGVRKVLLYYRPTRQTMEYAVATMDRRGDEYVATIPGKTITQDFDLMYYFEAFDEHGNGCLYPNPDVTQPYVVVKVRRAAANRISPVSR